MPQKTMRLDKQTYLVYRADNLSWTILLKKDESSTLCDPVFRKGWQDEGEVEIFSLLPPAEAGDEPLMHIRIYTKANETDNVPPVAHPAISIQSHLPAFTYVEPEKRQLRIRLLCVLQQEGRRLKITPIIEPEDV